MPLLRFEHEGCSKSEGGDCAELMESDGGGGAGRTRFDFCVALVVGNETTLEIVHWLRKTLHYAQHVTLIH